MAREPDRHEEMPWWRDGYALLFVATAAMWIVIFAKALILYILR